MEGEINSYSRDFLRRFGGEGSSEDVGGDDMGGIELSLGLTLGGCFGREESKDKKLVRASSVSMMGPAKEGPDEFGGLVRTCSMPAETEEERRRRKEMQSLKRREAKRKRSEKRAAALMKERKEEGSGGEELKVTNGGVLRSGEVAKRARGRGGRRDGGGGRKPASQGSIGSHGSSSSGVSDFESRPMQGVDISGLGSSAEVRSSVVTPTILDNTNHRAPTASLSQAAGKPASLSRDHGAEPSTKKARMTGGVNGVKEVERNMMEEMPCVSTKGDGPNGRRIEGFLYKYRKGEEVRIVCVCHGSFLTPAEFVKHAGGGDVAHPLRHIVVNPNPSGFL